MLVPPSTCCRSHDPDVHSSPLAIHSGTQAELSVGQQSSYRRPLAVRASDCRTTHYRVVV